jgi:tetratricopeptide (TPR) repeat protein
MLFLPQSVYDTRRRLWHDLEAGKIPAEKAFQKMLKLDPDDFVGLLGLGRLRLEAGDLAAAEEYFWRGLRAHPCTPAPYLQLAQFFNQRPEFVALANALGDLGIAKRALDDETFLEGLDFEEAGLHGEALEEFKELPTIAQAHVIAMAMREGRGEEPVEVTERVAPFRLLQQMQEEGDLDPETVDAIIGEGESMAPLLVGVMREWAQDLLGEEAGDGWVENALALLGETGTPSEIPHLLEFADLEDEDLSGAAVWALGRIIERHTDEAAEFIASIAPGFGMAERLVMVHQILRHPDLDPTGKLLNRMSENLESLKRVDRDGFFPLLLVAMATARGREGLKQGRAVLLQHSGLLSRDARRECDSLLAAVPPDFSPPPIEPSPVTVYDICAGNANWGEDEDEGEEEEEDQEFLPAPEPVRRKATPGRNDPCWCNSGKKYKKCHLESDERENSPAPVEKSAGSRGPDEFVGLRNRIGEFLGQVLPKRDIQLALEELFGDEAVEDSGSANLTITDWMLHDWIAPSLGRTVMQEFLVRRGSGLTPREREMVEAWTRSFVGLYEVQELKPGTGFTLKDLILGKSFFVHDVSMSTRLARWDGLLSRVVPGERGTELAGIGLMVPRHSLEPLHQWMEQDREETGLEWREYLKGNWPRIRRRSFDLAANWAESLRLSNTEGEEILFSKAVYKVIDEAAAIEALHQCPELKSESSEPEPPHFVWLNRQKTVLGNIHIEKGELVLESNSRERMERGKLLLSSLAGESLRHQRDEFTTQKEIKSRAAAAPRSARREEEIPKEERDEAIAHFLEEHYRAWPDMKLPALDGKTPREAVRTAKGRKQVIAVLKDMENGADRNRQKGEPAYDFARLRAELRLN